MTVRNEFKIGDLVEIVIKGAVVTHSDYSDFTVEIDADDAGYGVEIELPYEYNTEMLSVKKMQFPRRAGDVWKLNDGQAVVIFHEHPDHKYFSLTTLQRGMVSDVDWDKAERLSTIAE